MAGPVRSAAFQPLRKLQGLEKLPEAERALLEQLNAIRLDLARLQARPVFTELKTTDYQAREEETVRCAPGSADMTLQLPAPRKENQGSRITVLVESVALGTLTIQCIDGLVNDASSQTVSLVCRIDFVCDGIAGWRSEVGPGLVGLDSLPSALALSVLGRGANSSGVRADIQATAASGAVLRESGSVVGFGTVATAGIADAAVTPAKLSGGTVAVSGAGPHNDVALSADTTVVRVENTSTITGFTGGFESRVLYLYSIGVTPTLGHATGSSAGNQIQCPTGANLSLGVRGGAVLVYNAGGWRVTGSVNS